MNQRTGQTVSDTDMQAASDALASRLFELYLENGVLPSLQDIANEDKDQIIAKLNEQGYDVDASVWSGNLLFVGLGETSPLNENLLGDSNNSYDLFTSAAALQSAGLLTADEASWDTLWANLSFPFATAGSALSDINQYLASNYGNLAPMRDHKLVEIRLLCGLKLQEAFEAISREVAAINRWGN